MVDSTQNPQDQQNPGGQTPVSEEPVQTPSGGSQQPWTPSTPSEPTQAPSPTGTPPVPSPATDVPPPPTPEIPGQDEDKDDNDGGPTMPPVV